MDWAIVTWIILIGMVGLLWVMAMAVLKEEGDQESVEPIDKQSEPAQTIDGVQGHQRNVA